MRKRRRGEKKYLGREGEGEKESWNEFKRGKERRGLVKTDRRNRGERGVGKEGGFVERGEKRKLEERVSEGGR